MSEAELHILQARMLAGRNAKARRGELGKPVPMGYLRRPSGEVALDPDEQAQSVIRMVFALFERVRTVSGVLRYLVQNDIKMPVRLAGGPGKGELEWRRPSRPSLGDLFSNPIYAGVYVYRVRPIDRRRHKPGHPGSGRRSPRSENAEVFLRDRLPAYITWEQFQRNQEQIRANRTSERGPTRAGVALLSGMIVCGRCGLRMTASYNHAGDAARYQCIGARTSFDAPSCQALKAAPVDAEVTRLILKALEPAAIEASLAAALDLEAERKALNQHWSQRLERARHQVDQARRRYASVEPENRLVARTLEQDWETALGEQARLLADHERFQRERPQAPSPAELAAIQDLTQDLPALWRAETTTQQERQTIARLLLERVIVTVIGGSEQVRLECHWQGGNRTSHELVRPVAKFKTLNAYSDLAARACELHRAGRNCVEIASILNDEGWRPPKRRDTFNGPMVRRVLIGAGRIEAKRGTPRTILHRRPDEWTINELAAEIGAPPGTIYYWVQKGRLSSRSVEVLGSFNKLVTADAATIAKLKAVRATPLPFRRALLPSVNPNPPTLDS